MKRQKRDNSTDEWHEEMKQNFLKNMGQWMKSQKIPKHDTSNASKIEPSKNNEKKSTSRWRNHKKKTTQWKGNKIFPKKAMETVKTERLNR